MGPLDQPADLQRFPQDQSLPLPLLADPEHAVHPTYGFWGEKSGDGRIIGALRCTLVLDEAGRAESALYDVSTRGHVAGLRRCSLLDLSSA